MSAEMKLQGQMKALTEILAAGEPAPDADILRKEYGLLKVEVDANGKVKSFTPDGDKFSETILTAGFFASMTLKLDCGFLFARVRTHIYTCDNPEKPYTFYTFRTQPPAP